MDKGLTASGSSVAVYYIEADHLNTPRQVTRPSDNKQMWTWFSDPFGTTAANSNPAGAGTFIYNLRFPGQIYDSQAGLQQNYFRDYDPAIGRYVESDPIGLKAGINTYAYVHENPVSYNDPLGLDVSTWECDGQGNYVVINKDKDPCTSACTQAHEDSHIAEAKARFGPNMCSNKPPHYQPNAVPGGSWAFKWATECKAYGVEATCLRKLLNDCNCKSATQNRLRGAEEGVNYYCNTVPPHP